MIVQGGSAQGVHQAAEESNPRPESTIRNSLRHCRPGGDLRYDLFGHGGKLRLRKISGYGPQLEAGEGGGSLRENLSPCSDAVPPEYRHDPVYRV